MRRISWWGIFITDTLIWIWWWKRPNKQSKFYDVEFGSYCESLRDWRYKWIRYYMASSGRRR